MSRYFFISHGLRGCYMPDDCYVIKAKTRRELKAALAAQADMLRNESIVGLNRVAIASAVAQVWRNPAQRLDSVVPYRDCESCDSGYPFGLFVSNATRNDYVAQENE